jgi:hypothetical protein
MSLTVAAMVKHRSGTAVVELNLARRADVFAPLEPYDLRHPADPGVAVIPVDLVEFTTSVDYASGKSEGTITVQAPRSLIELGPIERSVMIFVCTIYARGATEDAGAITFTLNELAQFLGWDRPNAAQYDRLERAISAIASLRFSSWTGRIESRKYRTRKNKIKTVLERVTVSSIFGFIDEADLETRQQIAARRQNDNLPTNAKRSVKLWLGRRFREAIDNGVSVSVPIAALHRLGLKNRLALQLYFFVLSKKVGNQTIQVSADVLDSIVRPTASWRKDLRSRTEAACRLIMEADPRLHVSVVNAQLGGWKVVANFANPPPAR